MGITPSRIDQPLPITNSENKRYKIFEKYVFTRAFAKKKRSNSNDEYLGLIANERELNMDLDLFLLFYELSQGGSISHPSLHQLAFFLAFAGEVDVSSISASRQYHFRIEDPEYSPCTDTHARTDTRTAQVLYVSNILHSEEGISDPQFLRF